MRQFKTQYYQLTLTFSPPFLTQASGTLTFGKDVAMQRYQKKPVINGSLIRGNIRGALESFVTVLGEEHPQGARMKQFIHDWFGKSPNNEGDARLTTERSRLSFDMFWQLEGEAPEAKQRTRIQLDASGKVEEGALQVIEDCFPAGSGDIRFTAQIQARLSQDAATQKQEKIALLRHLKLALDNIPAMGSLKGIGFGELKNSNLKECASPQALNSDTLNGVKTRIGFRFTLDRPFCLGKPRTPESNRIVSDTVITGNVIKGVIAEAFRGQKNWQSDFCFDDLSISHAFPVAEGCTQADVPIPLSMAFVELRDSDSEAAIDATNEEELGDFASLTKPMDQDWGKHVFRAPIFQPDWKKKHWEKASKEFNNTQKEPGKWVMVRTGINQQQGVSEESQLFSLECTDPTGFYWQGEISLAQVPQEKRADVIANLQAFLAEGLDNIGKTRASARDVALYPLAENGESADLSSLQVGDRVIITLMTDARMMMPGFERQPNPPSLRSLYQDYWSALTRKADTKQSALRLDDFYSQQYREGGQFHHAHYQKKLPYMPEWMTKAGSVFVLNILDPEGVELLQQWSERGLPVTAGLSSSSSTWQTTPYLPEHGFGRIKVNCTTQAQFMFEEVSGG